MVGEPGEPGREPRGEVDMEGEMEGGDRGDRLGGVRCPHCCEESPSPVPLSSSSSHPLSLFLPREQRPCRAWARVERRMFPMPASLATRAVRLRASFEGERFEGGRPKDIVATGQ